MHAQAAHARKESFRAPQGPDAATNHTSAKLPGLLGRTSAAHKETFRAPPGFDTGMKAAQACAVTFRAPPGLEAAMKPHETMALVRQPGKHRVLGLGVSLGLHF